MQFGEGRIHDGFYQGCYLLGEGGKAFPSGEGIYKKDDGRTVSGNWQEGYVHGIAIARFANADYCNGTWEKNRFISGKIRTTQSDQSCYEGEWENELPHGEGLLSYPNDDFKKGTWERGILISGIARITLPNKEVYQGRMEKGVISGHGTKMCSDGSFYEGDFLDEKFHGKGKWRAREDKGVFLKDGKWEQGKFKIGKIAKKLPDLGIYTGDGVEGIRKNAIMQGMGKVVWLNESWIEGFWIDEKKEGRFRGQFHNGFYFQVDYKKNSVITDYFVEGNEGIRIWNPNSGGKFSKVKQLTLPDGSIFIFKDFLLKNPKVDFKYRGAIKSEKFHGIGEFIQLKEGWKFKGTFYDGGLEEGILECKGKWRYNGRFQNNRFEDSEGEFTFSKNRMYKGAFVDGKFHGIGILFTRQGNLGKAVKGRFSEGMLVEIIKEVENSVSQ